MNAASTLSKVDRLRARDGDECWLCGGPFDFSAVPNTKNAPTLEHLVAKTNDGPGRLENLVLCHPHCNRQLNTRPIAEKIAMRNRRINKAEAQVAAWARQDGKVLKEREAVTTPAMLQSSGTPVNAAPVRTSDLPWRTIAWAAIACAAFFAGLALGLLLR